MSDQREAIRSNAKYLRNVRPIDPDEICEYVEGNPHPAVVRQHLREDAVDLGLIEREDGTFEPVPEEPIRPNLRPVTTFPSTYADALEEFLVDQYGVNWHEDATGDLLRSTIRRFKSSYLERRAVEYTEDVAAGYAIYHLPAYYAAIQYALEDLADRGLLDRTMRVLDVGAGVGGPALGLADYLPDDALLEYHALEPSSAADILEDLLPETGRNVHTSVHRTTAEAFDPATVTRGEQTDAATPFDPTAADDGFDLILACNVLSELTDPEAVLRDYLELLAPDGTLVAIAPADKNTSVQLRDLERTLEDERLLTQSVFDDEEVGGGEASDQTDATSDDSTDAVPLRSTARPSGSGRASAPRIAAGRSTSARTSRCRNSSANSTRQRLNTTRTTHPASSSTSTCSTPRRCCASMAPGGSTLHSRPATGRKWPKWTATSRIGSTSPQQNSVTH